jgi:hypothetical protein
MALGVRFFTLADSRYFPGLVALVNSLRLQGHHDPITVLDLGLSSDQRGVLGGQCEFVPAPVEAIRHPWLMQPYACMVRPADTVVYIDADIIVTHPLDTILASARQGRICVFANATANRWFSEWETVFGVSGPLRRQTYFNAGFLAFSTERFPDLLSRWWACCGRVVGHPTILEGATLASPTALSSQDALNALLMSEIGPHEIEFQPPCAEAQGPEQLARTRVVDVNTLACRLDGHPTTLLHAWGKRKPWEHDAARGLRRSAYLVCLRRLLTKGEVAVSFPVDQAPLWLRPGLGGTVALWGLTSARRPIRGIGAWLRRARRLAGRVMNG